MARPISAEDKKWRAEQDLRTLREAKEIQASAARTRAAQAVARKDMKALNAIAKPKRK